MLKYISKSFILFYIFVITLTASWAYIDNKYDESNEDVVVETYSAEEYYCLASTIFHEAGNQPDEGKEAVALVVLNRSSSDGYPTNICDVVNQKTRFKNKTVCQFSYACEKKIPPYGVSWKKSLDVAKNALDGIFDGKVLQSVGNSIYYHADYVNPRWGKPKITKIGRHIFYKERV